MTALTKDRVVPNRSGDHVSHPVKAGVKLYAGALVCLDAAGWAVPGATATTLTAVGRAEKPVDNTAGANGDVFVLARKAVFRFYNEATDLVDRTSIGKDCYVVDDATVAKTDGGDPATRSVAGKVVDVDDDGVWVDLR